MGARMLSWWAVIWAWRITGEFKIRALTLPGGYVGRVHGMPKGMCVVADSADRCRRQTRQVARRAVALRLVQAPTWSARRREARACRRFVRLSGDDLSRLDRWARAERIMLLRHWCGTPPAMPLPPDRAARGSRSPRCAHIVRVVTRGIRGYRQVRGR